MYSLLFLGFASFVLSLFLTPMVRNLALRFGLVDCLTIIARIIKCRSRELVALRFSQQQLARMPCCC